MSLASIILCVRIWSIFVYRLGACLFDVIFYDVNDTAALSFECEGNSFDTFQVLFGLAQVIPMSRFI